MPVPFADDPSMLKSPLVTTEEMLSVRSPVFVIVRVRVDVWAAVALSNARTEGNGMIVPGEIVGGRWPSPVTVNVVKAFEVWP
jgi:hypothetical protein